ncbi:MAG: class I SAM-dependent methyltransferase [Deltaproteobacteria bacterium]|nr:class I SAM-dependent methyltransferase [Deltaproteobacteria bacterium]MDZ4341096.1 class I SAM-dependent methyltransferase [Candidatus Binatia bacterium]
MKSHNKALAPERDSIIVCRTSQGYEVRATPLRITRHVTAFEVYNPYSILQLSEVLKEFSIIVNEQLIYSGRATVSNLVNTGTMLVCEATLDEGWLDVDLFALVTQPQKLRADFTNFFKEWERIHFILPQYKIVLADMQNYFMDLKRWLEQVELGIRSSPSGDRLKTELEVSHELAPTILPTIDSLFARFEDAADEVPVDLRPLHRTYAKRQLHSQLLCSPFAFRTYQKPLGYAGDYEMVNMILRDPLEGSSLFSKIVNSWFLSQRPAEAHRNRISYITKLIAKESRRVTHNGRTARIFNLGCGPAGEVQEFLIQDEVCNHTSFVLLDFNDETLQHTRKVLEDLKSKFRRGTEIELVKRSVHQVLRDETKVGAHQQRYDLVYCAGIFDYLSDRICKRLMDIFYDMLEPGGLLVATNVDASNPSRNGMEYLLEWHLIYRNPMQLRALIPDRAPRGSASIKSDETGVNIYLEVRKPHEG